MKRHIVGLATLLWVFGGAGHAAAASFQGLGSLGGQSYASSVSDDGSVVVGSSGTSGPEAFRWTAAGGMVGLGMLPGGSPDIGSEASDVSADGAVVVGDSDSSSGRQAFRWTAAGGMVALGEWPGGGIYVEAGGVSADGSVVGMSSSGTQFEAFRWTISGDIVGLGDLPGGGFYSSASAVSADGAIVVGESYSGSGNEAFRWTAGGGMVGLGDLAGGVFDSWATGVSGDGSVVVGQSSSANGNEAFYWREDLEPEPMAGLGDLPGGFFSSCAHDVSADGSIIVGKGVSDSGSEAFLFEDSMHNLKDLLTGQFGLDLTGWQLGSATAVTPNGRGIVGWGCNPAGDQEAWRVLLDPLELNWTSSTSGSWDDAENWDFCHPATDVTDVYIQPTSGLTVLGPADLAIIQSLTVDAQFGTATLSLQASGKLAVIGQALIDQRGRLAGEGMLVAPGGITNWGEIDLGTGNLQLSGGLLNNWALVHGSGQIHNALQNHPSGEVRVQSGQRMIFTASGNVNSGNIEVIGGEIEFAGGLYNEPSTGLISARDATLRFGTGLTNDGWVGVSFGTTDVFGDVTNTTDGAIVLSGASNTTFYDNVANDGSFRVSTGSTAVFFGDFSGSQGATGDGVKFFEGDLRPGHSAAEISFGGDVVFGTAAGLEIELGGLDPGQYDAVDVAGTASLDGQVRVSEIDSFEALPGDEFTVLTYGTRTGEFDDVDTPAMPAGLLADLIYNDPAGEGVLQFDGLAGDANLDGYVDEDDLDDLAAHWDETGVTRAWKRGDFNDDGSIDIGDLTLMAGNWETSIFDGGAPEPFDMALFDAALEQAVAPEPGTLGLLACAAGTLLMVGRCRRWRRTAI